MDEMAQKQLKQLENFIRQQKMPLRFASPGHHVCAGEEVSEVDTSQGDDTDQVYLGKMLLEVRSHIKAMNELGETLNPIEARIVRKQLFEIMQCLEEVTSEIPTIERVF